MDTIDLSPLYRTMVGFDRLATMIDSASRLDGSDGYPPYNIAQTADNAYTIEIAAAGFSSDDLDIELKEGVLTVQGRKAGSAANKRQFLYQGIAERGFARRFQLADHVEVSGADFSDGMIRVDLARELPEAMKPRKIKLGTGGRKIETGVPVAA